MHTLLSTNHLSPSLGLDPMATTVQFPYWLGQVGTMLDGWQKTSATLTRAGMPVAEYWAHFHPSMDGARAKTRSVHQHTHIGSHASRQVHIYLGQHLFPPHSPFFNIFLFWGGGVLEFNFLCYIALGWYEDDRSYPGQGWFIKLSRVSGRTVHI